MDKLRNWYNANYTPITWFIIGLLFNNVLVHISHGQYGMALIDVVLAGINFYFWKTRYV